MDQDGNGELDIEELEAAMDKMGALHESILHFWHQTAVIVWLRLRQVRYYKKTSHLLFIGT